MTYEYINDVGEQRRIHALEKAIESGVGHDSTDEILSRAREFEGYLRGDEKTAASGVTITVNDKKARW